MGYMHVILMVVEGAGARAPEVQCEERCARCGCGGCAWMVATWVAMFASRDSCTVCQTEFWLVWYVFDMVWGVGCSCVNGMHHAGPSVQNDAFF